MHSLVQGTEQVVSINLPMSVVYLKRQCQSLSQLFETLAVLYQYKCLFFNRGSPSLFLVAPLLRAEQLTWLLWCTYGCIFDCLLVIRMICKCTTLGTSYNEQIDAKKTARCSRVLVVTKLFNIVVNDCDAKKSTRCRRVLVVTELVVSGTRCNS